MKAIVGDFIISSDSRQYIVSEKFVVEPGALSKEENIGKEYEKPIGYFRNLKDAYKFIGERTVRTNDDIELILSKLEEIKNILLEKKAVDYE